MFVLATGTMMNANTALYDDNAFVDCLQDAWDFGTEHGNGDEALEYQFTNTYFILNCNEDGSYRLRRI